MASGQLRKKKRKKIPSRKKEKETEREAGPYRMKTLPVGSSGLFFFLLLFSEFGWVMTVLLVDK